MDKEGGFIGQPVLKEQKVNGYKRKLIATKMVDRGVPRHGMEVADMEGNIIGHVTTGGYAPSLNANIANCIINTPVPEVGEQVQIMIRGKGKKAERVKMPYYTKHYAK